MDRIPRALEDRVTTAESAARLIKTGMTLGMSGFTIVGYPKAVPKALAESGHAGELTILIGASVGDELDGALTRAGLVKRRFSYQSNKDMRAAINAGSMGYADMHVSEFPRQINEGTGPDIDFAVVEAAAVTEKGIVPTASAGCTDAVVRRAKKVIVEVNRTVPAEIAGMHDIFQVGVPPFARIIPIINPSDHIGLPYIPCKPEKIAAIVFTDTEDQPAKFKAVTPATAKIGENVAGFLKSEIAAGRLPEDPGPIQSGVGSVGNAVLESLSGSGFRGLTMYTEVMQDAALKLLESGVLRFASASAVSLEEESRKYFYQHIREFQDKILIRPQEISNNPEVIRRLGVIAVNTPIEADIYGNVNSTHVMGGGIMNGIGGSGDFARNARISIFATESTAKGGNISCIVPLCSHIDHTEHDVQVIITEQGTADLRWKTPLERAELIIENCAHPDYRPALREYLDRAKKCSSGGHEPTDFGSAFSFHQRYLETGSMK